MRRAGGWAALALAVISAVSVAWGRGARLDLLAAEADAERARIERDSLAADAAAERARAAGWEAVFGLDDPDSLAARLAELDSARARDLRASNLRAEQLTEIVATLRDSLDTQGSVVAAPTVDAATGEITGAWAGSFDDGWLDGAWEFSLPAVRLALDLEVRCPAAIVTSRAGDGRTLVTARGLEPRCRPEVRSVYVDPPPPLIVERRPSFADRLKNAVIWGGAGYLLGRTTR